MWEFLSNVLERAGFVATVFALVMLGCGAAVAALWKQNQKLHEQIQRVLADSAKKAEEASQRHASELKALADDHSKQLAQFAKRVDDLQERRVKEASTLTERVMEHIKHIDQFAAKLEATIDVVLQATRHR